MATVKKLITFDKAVAEELEMVSSALHMTQRELIERALDFYFDHTDTAVKDLQQFNTAEGQMIAKKLKYICENFEALKESKKITRLKGMTYKHYRFVIARKIRAIFELLEDGELILLILKIGKRKDIYDT